MRTEYITPDLYLAAYLRVLGVKYLRTERAGHRAVFIFEGSEESLKDNIDGFVHDTQVVPPNAYSMQLKYLKGVIHRI